jgi:hypothetical protein
MITFFTSCKPFTGVIAVNQRNALQSWLTSAPGAEVLLFGKEEGAADAARALGIEDPREVGTTEQGTPRLDLMFERAQREARNGHLCFINADIILLADFARAVGIAGAWAQGRPFAMVGHRFDLDWNKPIDFASPRWSDALRAYALAHGRRSASNAIDYFLFPRGTVPSMPAFAIGRPAWDNWLIMDLERRRVPLLDASDSVLAIHQNHGYGHVPGATGRNWEGPEADRNRALALSETPSFRPLLHTINNASWILAQGRVRRALSARHLGWRMYLLLEKRLLVSRATRLAAFARRRAQSLMKMVTGPSRKQP